MNASDQPAVTALKVVLIEDTRELAASIAKLLARESFEVHVSHDAETGLALVRDVPADLVLLDVTLPGMDGIEACRRLRTFSDAYVIMLTSLGAEVDRLIGLSVGADDYMTKPVSPRELIARIRAMQRRPRSTEVPRPVRHFGGLEVDLDARQVRVVGEPVDLSRTEYELLDALTARPRLTLSRAQLLEQVWGESWFGDDHVVDVHISNLRRKLGDDSQNPKYIATVRGFGYRMGDG